MNRSDRNDRDRLKEVHQSDLTEGRINQDFVDWLQTKGTTYLLIALVGLCLYFGYVRWQNYRSGHQTEAWTELNNASGLPSSYENIAEKYQDIGAVPHLARMRAAHQLLAAVQIGKTLGAQTETKKDLTDAERVQYLDRADRLYAKIVESDDHSPQKALLVLTALTGRAAVAESKAEPELAKQYYNQAAQRAEGLFPKLAEQARRRAGTVDQNIGSVTLPSQDDLAAVQRLNKPATPLDPVNLDPWVHELVMPQQ